MNESSLRTAFFFVLLTGVLILTFFLFRPFLVMFAIAATAVVILHPVHDRILKRVGKRPRTAAFLTVAITILLVLIPLTLIGTQIATEAADLYADLRDGTASLPTDALGALEDVVQRYVPGMELDVNRYASQGLNWITDNLQALFAGTFHTLFLIFLGIITYYYLLKDGKTFVRSLMDLSPLKEEENRKLVQRLHLAVNSVIRGSLIIAMLQGIATGVGLLIFGVPSAFLLGSIAGVGALIPTVGTSIVIGPVVLYLAFIGEYVSAAGFLAWGIVAVGLIDNFLHPILVGRGMKMHPLFIFFAVIGGVSLFGMAGFILGPLVISLLFGLLDIFRKEKSHTS